MSTWVYALASAVALSLGSLVGALLLGASRRSLRRAAEWLVALAAGALLADVFLHLLPHAYQDALQTAAHDHSELHGGHTHGPSPWPLHRVGLLVLAGVLGFYALDAWLRARHRAHTHTHTHERAVPLVLVGDGLHNLLDGILLAAAYTADPHLGLATTLALLLHELPQELGDFGILVRAGLGVRRALLFNFYSGLASVGGVVLGLGLGQVSEAFANALIPVAAGNFLYLSLATLVPMLQGRWPFRYALLRLGVVAAGALLLLGLHLLTEGGHSH
jgi:zinc and cadmium transporter